MNHEFERRKQTDVTVYSMLRLGHSLEDIIVRLCREKDIFLQRALELEQIAPRKYIQPDGTVLIWRCPDELVPAMKGPLVGTTTQQEEQPAPERR